MLHRSMAGAGAGLCWQPAAVTEHKKLQGGGEVGAHAIKSFRP